jgi:MFS family permease
LEAGILDIGIVFVAIQIATTLVSIPGGVLADRHGRKIVIVSGNALGFGLYFALLGVSNWTVALFILFAATFFATLVQPASSSIVAESVKPDDRSRAFGTFLFFVYLGLALGGIVGGLYSNWVDIAIVATSGVVAASVRLLFLKETLPVSHRVNPRQKRFVTRLSRDVWLLLMAMLVFNFSSGLGQPLYAIFSADILHLTKWELGLMVGLGFLAGMFGAFLAGKISAKLGVTKMMVMAVIVASFLLIPWLYSPNALLAVVIFAASGFFAQFYFVGNQALMADLTLAKERGSIIGFVTTVAGFGGIIAPYIGSRLWVSLDPRSPFLISSLLAIAVAVPLVLIRRTPIAANCPHCGRAVPQEARFCDSCGEPMVYRMCSACGRRLEETASFCDSCGSRQVAESH